MNPNTLTPRHVIVQVNGTDSIVGKLIISEHPTVEAATAAANELQEKTEAYSYAVLALVGQTKPVRASKFTKVKP